MATAFLEREFNLSSAATNDNGQSFEATLCAQMTTPAYIFCTVFNGTRFCVSSPFIHRAHCLSSIGTGSPPSANHSAVWAEKKKKSRSNWLHWERGCQRTATRVQTKSEPDCILRLIVANQRLQGPITLSGDYYHWIGWGGRLVWREEGMERWGGGVSNEWGGRMIRGGN